MITTTMSGLSGSSPKVGSFMFSLFYYGAHLLRQFSGVVAVRGIVPKSDRVERVTCFTFVHKNENGFLPARVPSRSGQVFDLFQQVDLLGLGPAAIVKDKDRVQCLGFHTSSSGKWISGSEAA